MCRVNRVLLLCFRLGLGLCFVLCYRVVARAQGNAPVRIESFPAGMVELKEGWRFRPGDNPEWASAQFDDERWRQVTPEDDLSCGAACWYRIRSELSAQHPPLALLVIADQGAIEAYVDGQRSSEAHIEPWWLARERVAYVLPIPEGGEAVSLAIRIHPPHVAFDSQEAVHISASVGSPEAVKGAAAQQHAKRVLLAVTSIGINLVIFLAGSGVLLLFASQRGSPEYLWLGVYLTLVGSSDAVLAGSTYALVPGVTNELYADPAIYLFLIAQIEFTYAFIRRKPSRIWRAYEILLLCCPVATICCATGILGNDSYFLMESVVALPAALSLPLLLLYWRRRGNTEARWLIFPSLCPAFGVAVSNSPQVADFFGWKFSLLNC